MVEAPPVVVKAFPPAAIALQADIYYVYPDLGKLLAATDSARWVAKHWQKSGRSSVLNQ